MKLLYANQEFHDQFFNACAALESHLKESFFDRLFFI